MTRQQYELNCEILQSLDNIDNCVMESETLVMDSIMDAYSKAVTVLEHCSDTADISSFNIIQESFILEDGEDEPTGDKGNNKEKLIMKILLFIPRMIKKFIDFLLSKTGIGNDMKKLVTRIDELEKMSKSDKEKIIQLMKDNEDTGDKRYSEVNEKIKKVSRDQWELSRDHSNLSHDQWKLSRDISNLYDLNHKVNEGINSNMNRNRNRFNEIEDVINIMNGNITTDLDFDKTKMVYDDIVKMFKVLEKYDIHKPSTLSKDIRQQISLDKDKTEIDIWSDTQTTVGNPKLMKLPVFRKNMHDILDLRIEITQIGQRVCDKLNEQAKVFNNGTKLNKNQQKKLDDFNMVSKYITQYMSITEDLESIISADVNRVLNHFISIKRVHIKAESK